MEVSKFCCINRDRLWKCNLSFFFFLMLWRKDKSQVWVWSSNWSRALSNVRWQFEWEALYRCQDTGNHFCAAKIIFTWLCSSGEEIQIPLRSCGKIYLHLVQFQIVTDQALLSSTLHKSFFKKELCFYKHSIVMIFNGMRMLGLFSF